MRIGIDLGGTKIELRALDQTGQELIRLRVDTPRGDYQGTLNAITALVHRAESQLNQAGSLGICIPGTLSPDTGRVKNANSVCLIGQPLDKDLEQRLQRPIHIANDADCLALSEASDGAGKDYASVFAVILGTGVGGGICINGQLLTGPNAIAGEWGHNPLPWSSHADSPKPACYCGKKGCIETYLSGPGLCHQYAQLTGQEVKQAETVIDLYRAGDTAATEVFTRYCDRIARGLSSVINVLDPEVIVLGGGISNVNELYQEIPQRWGQYVFSDQVNTQLKQALHGDSSGVLGAARLWPAEVF